MTYATIDTSTDQGQPYELFDFIMPGTSQAWYYTTEAEARTYASNVYTPEAIVRGEVERRIGSLGGNCMITVPDSNTLAGTLFQALTVKPVQIAIRQFHRTDTDAGSIVVFRGYVSGVSFAAGVATIVCSPKFTFAARRKVVWITYQAGCNWAWGEAQCGVDKDAFRTDASLSSTAQVGRVLTVPALSAAPAGDYNGGWVERIATSEIRFIESQTAGALTLAAPFTGLTGTAEAFHVFPGCRNNESDCATRFSNLPNYLGWSRLPSINPFNRSAYYLGPLADTPDPGDAYDIPEFPGYRLWVADTRCNFLDSYGSGHFSLSFYPSGALGGSMTLLAGTTASDGVVITETDLVSNSGEPGHGWVDPIPPSGGLPALNALFEIWVDTPVPVDATRTAAPDTGTATYGAWLPMSSVLTWKALGSVMPGATGQYLGVIFTVRIRAIADGLIKVQGDFTVGWQLPG